MLENDWQNFYQHFFLVTPNSGEYKNEMIYKDKKVFEDLVQEIKELTPKEITLWGLQIKVPLIFHLVLYFFSAFLN